MSEETPNQSEERLQRHAKERRAQGGDFALHPATRQMLQGEVARTFGAKKSAAKSRGWFSWLKSWNGRVAIGAAAVVVITGSWIFWNSRLDQRAMQLARADLPVRTFARADNEGSRGEISVEKKFAMTAAPATPPPPVATLRAAAISQQAERDAGKIAADKMPVVDALAKNSSVAAVQEQLGSVSQLAGETTLSLAPVAPNFLGANATDARSQQSFNYANAAGQNIALAGQAAATLSDRYQNQAGQVSGGALAYANNEAKPLMEAEAAFKSQANAPAPAAAPYTVTRTPETLARNAELLRNSIVSSGATANDDSAGVRFFRADADGNDPTRSKALAPASRPLTETAPVLNDFIIEQRGATVRVVDADGSVYDGAVEVPPSAGFVPGKDAAAGPVREVIPGDNSETAPRHQELSFRAAGSNVTLRQTVVVNGRFTPGTEAGRAGRARPAEAPSKITDLAARRAVPATSNAFAGQYGAATNATSTIEGTVRIGTTNQQWFRAYRRAP